MQNKVKDIVYFSVRRNITNLFKNFLEILEDLNLPEEEHQKYRKKILDDGNNRLREIEELFNNLD